MEHGWGGKVGKGYPKGFGRAFLLGRAGKGGVRSPAKFVMDFRKGRKNRVKIPGLGYHGLKEKETKVLKLLEAGGEWTEEWSRGKGKKGVPRVTLITNQGPGEVG